MFFYGTVIRPVLEYACPVWHSSLIRAGLDTVESRREQPTKRFFKRSVLPETSCLHYLLSDKRDVSVTGRLRHAS